jgi:hypothetical protein
MKFNVFKVLFNINSKPALYMEYILDWTEIRPICEIEYSKDNPIKGVYIWGFILNSNFIPYYLGVAENIKYRLLEHVSSLMGGKYTIYKKDYLHKFYDFKDTKLNDGIIYIPDWPFNYRYFLQEFKNLQPHLNYMVENFYYSFAELKDVERNELFIIEKICIDEIGKHKLHLFRGGIKDSSYKIKVTGNPIITNLFKSTSRQLVDLK